MAASLVAAVCGVARSWTRLKPLSGSGSSRKSAAFTDHGGNPNSARGKRLTVFLVVLHMQFDLLFLFNKNIIKHQLIPCPTPSRKNNSVQFSCSVLSYPLRPHGLQHARPPCPSPTPGVYSNWCPLSQWFHPAISPSVVSSSHLQSFPAPVSFQMSQSFTSGGQSIGVSVSASVLPMNTQDWSPLGWTGWISSQSKGLSRVFSNTTVWKHPFFEAQLSL